MKKEGQSMDKIGEGCSQSSYHGNYWFMAHTAHASDKAFFW